jgi:nitroreductase
MAARESAWSMVPGAMPGSSMRACLRAAIAAPSVHNTQPWLFRPLDDRLEVLADERRRLAVLDPAGRDMLLSVGAAVCNLRVAVEARGRRSLVDLLPYADRPDVVAVVRLGESIPTDPRTAMLARAIERRRTNRRPFSDRPLPEWLQTALVESARAEGATLVFVDEIGRYDVLTLADAAESVQRSDSRYLAELAAWTGTNPASGRRDGVPSGALGPRPDRSPTGMREFGRPDAERPSVARYEAKPTIAVLYTPGDERRDWVRAGQAMQRVLLTATAYGVATGLLTQPVEVPQARAQLSGRGEPRTAHVVLRLGYGPRSPATPRRPLVEVLVG